MRLPSALTLGAMQESFRDVWSALSPLTGTLPVDWQGRRHINVADGIAVTDAVTLRQLDVVRALMGSGGATASTPGSGAVRVGLFAARGSAVAHRFQWFLATDQNYVAWVSTGAVWVYVSGIMSGTLSPNTKPTALLTTNDVGYLFRSTDFDRVYRWSGSAWAWMPDQLPILFICYRDSTGVPPGWALCDGATVTRSTFDAATASYTTPDLITDKRFIRSSAITNVQGGSATTHTHAVDPPSTASGGPSGTTVVQSGTGTTVASDGHTHTTDIASFASGVPSGTGGDDALPPYWELVPMVRI